MTAGLVAVTGATGFLGRHLVRTLADDGWRVRILARRDPIDPLWAGTEPQVVFGDLGDRAALAALCDGADAVIHAAGLVKARNAREFHRVNADGAQRVAEAARDARFVLISSLAAREPRLSDYAASKRAGETAVAQVLGDAAIIVRPPAVYGPGDTETFGLFRAAATSPVLPILNGDARLALIHVEDAARQIAALASSGPAGAFAISDDRPDGYGWRELMTMAADSVGRRPKLVPLPDLAITVLGLAGAIGRIAGAVPMLTPGKAREILHRDWSVTQAERAAAIPACRFGIREGFLQTAAWYRAAGWLALG